MQGAYPVFQQTDVKRAFDVACAAFQGRFLRNGESVLVRDGVPSSPFGTQSPLHGTRLLLGGKGGMSCLYCVVRSL